MTFRMSVSLGRVGAPAVLGFVGVSVEPARPPRSRGAHRTAAQLCIIALLCGGVERALPGFFRVRLRCKGWGC
ncbi:protein of unknown function [Methylococcus capsulatus]|uniref:Uncharacterized protein n=1 Tax=Methylococcus capsulatus TaxID=414 RepID=A0AA35UA47_METCP|nr:protein of unknown function [Methylococcus capsulatus]